MNWEIGIDIYTVLILCIKQITNETWASLVAQMVKNLPARQETQVPSLREDPLEQDMATHSSILAWIIPWTEEPGGLQSMGRKELDTTEQLTLSGENKGCVWTG